MSVSTNTSVHSRVISALFDSGDTAKRAVDALVAAGIPREHITQSGGGAGTAAGGAQADRGFWESLKHLFLPHDDRHAYAEGLRRGGYLVALRADEANDNRVLDILDNEGSVNMDEREQEWKSEGWRGFVPAAAGPGVGVGGIDPIVASEPVGPAFGTAGSGVSEPARADTAARSPSPGSFSIAGEQDTGFSRRDLGHGRSRVRSYVFDTPAEAMPGSAPTGSDTGQFSRITEHMDVISADGQKIGEVDHLDGPDRIKLSRNSSPDGQHHMVPFSWIDHVDRHVHLSKTLAEIKAGR